MVWVPALKLCSEWRQYRSFFNVLVLVVTNRAYCPASPYWLMLELRNAIPKKSSARIVKEPADQMIVGIDGAFVGATSSKNQRRHFEVVLGRIEPIGGSSKVFAAVRDLDDLARERVCSALRAAGRGPATKLTVLSDCEDAMCFGVQLWV